MIELQAALKGVDEISRQLGATPADADKALRVTVGRMAGWLKRKTSRELSSDLRIGLDVLRYRMRTLRRGGMGSRAAALWFGLNPVAVTHLDPREVARGVRGGPAYVKGGFIAKRQVFKRRGRARLPIERAEFPIQQQADATLQRVVDGAEFQRRFLDTFEQELTKRWT